MPAAYIEAALKAARLTASLHRGGGKHVQQVGRGGEAGREELIFCTHDLLGLDCKNPVVQVKVRCGYEV